MTLIEEQTILEYINNYKILFNKINNIEKNIKNIKNHLIDYLNKDNELIKLENDLTELNSEIVMLRSSEKLFFEDLNKKYDKEYIQNYLYKKYINIQ